MLICIVTVLCCLIYPRRYFVAEDGSLKIQKLAMEDGGMFQCVASNSAGQATAYTWLKVKSKSVCLCDNLIVC